MPTYFAELGARLERAWATDRDEERFSSIASEVLDGFAPKDHLDIEALIDRLLDSSFELGRQIAPLGTFGQPGFTLHHGRGFVVDVYFWTHGLSAIHNHPFSGAFTLLKGESVHARYSFEVERAFGPRIAFGTATMQGLDLVAVGHVEPFSLRDRPLIHALIHVPNPSVSMVVRTVRTHGYLRYFPPHVALALEPSDDAVARSLALLSMLERSKDPRFEARADRFLETADLDATFHLLLDVSLSGHDHAVVERLTERARSRHGAFADRFAPSIARAARMREADTLRATLSDADDRLLATVLMLAESRAHVLSILATRHTDPLGRLHRFIDERAILEPDEGARRVIAHALVDGVGLRGATARLAVEYGETMVSEARAEIERYGARSAFAALSS